MIAPSNSASALSGAITGIVTNFKPDAGTWAAGGAGVLTLLIGCALVGAGIAIPPISVFGLTLLSASTPITMGMVAAAIPVVSHFVSAYVPATYSQQIDAFAKKIGTDVETLKEVVPVIQDSYPTGKNGETAAAPISQSNIVNAIGADDAGTTPKP